MGLESKQFFYLQNIASTTLLYGRMGDAGGYSVQGFQAAVGNGTTTVTASTGTPFDPIQGNATTGDVLIFSAPGQTDQVRRCTAKASGSSITIDSALAAGTWGWRFYPFRSGSAPNTTTGFHYVGNWFPSSVLVNVTAQPATSLDYQLETLTSGPGSSPIIITGPTSISTATSTKVTVPDRVVWLRVGIKITGAGTDTVSISALGDPRGR
jgi:hypothetical protein